MMIAAIDVYYPGDMPARAGVVVFSAFCDTTAHRTYTCNIPRVEEYIPGRFYLRELPCIMAVLGLIEEQVDTLIIDGYVDLGDRPGLGRHLWKALDGKIRIMGVAKTHYRGVNAVEVFRGKSRQPLYVTAAGIDPAVAAELITHMHGAGRIPALIRQADALSRRVRFPARETERQ